MGGIKSIQYITINNANGAGSILYTFMAHINVLTGDITVENAPSNTRSTEEIRQQHKERLMACDRLAIGNGGLPSVINMYNNRNVEVCDINTTVDHNILVRFDHIVNVKKTIVLPPISLHEYRNTAGTPGIYKIFPAGLLYVYNSDAPQYLMQVIEFA